MKGEKIYKPFTKIDEIREEIILWVLIILFIILRLLPIAALIALAYLIFND